MKAFPGRKACLFLFCLFVCLFVCLVAGRVKVAREGEGLGATLQVLTNDLYTFPGMVLSVLLSCAIAFSSADAPDPGHCAADYGTPLNGPVCCGQTGQVQQEKSICPKDRPKCVGFVQQKLMGTCTSGSNEFQCTFQPQCDYSKGSRESGSAATQATTQ